MSALQTCDGILVDLDGVVWLSHEPIDGSVEAIAAIRASGRPVIFVTNDPRSTRAELAARLSEVGAPTEPEELITSASATAATIAEERAGAPVMAVGASALASELSAAGVEVVGVAEDARAEVVAIGGGSDFDYELLRITHEAVREGGELWATNKDPAYPTANGLVPGTGAFVAAVEYATGVTARCVGKPDPGIFAEAVSALASSRPLMVGDSLDSDIAGAARAGLATVLVLTGRSTREALAAADVQPDFVFESLAAVAAGLVGDTGPPLTD